MRLSNSLRAGATLATAGALLMGCGNEGNGEITPTDQTSQETIEETATPTPTNTPSLTPGPTPTQTATPPYEFDCGIEENLEGTSGVLETQMPGVIDAACAGIQLSAASACEDHELDERTTHEGIERKVSKTLFALSIYLGKPENYLEACDPEAQVCSVAVTDIPFTIDCSNPEREGECIYGFAPETIQIDGESLSFQQSYLSGGSCENGGFKGKQSELTYRITLIEEDSIPQNLNIVFNSCAGLEINWE